MTFLQLKEQVYQLISNARTADALDLMISWAQDNNQSQLQSDLALLKSDLTDLSRQKNLNIIDPSDANIRQNKLNKSTLSILNDMDTVVEAIQPVKTPVSLSRSDLEYAFLKYIIEKEGKELSFEFAKMNNLSHKDIINLANYFKEEGFISTTELSQDRLLLKILYKGQLEFEKRSALINNAQNISPSVDQPITTQKPKIYFSYAWGDDDETGDSREKIVHDLYESLKADQYDVRRDKEDIQYKDLISDFMQEIGRGDFIVVAISDKYLRSPNCMFEMYEIFRNSKLERAAFKEKIFPIRVESIRLSDPTVLDGYFEHWNQQEKNWEALIVKQGTRISPAQQLRYKRIKDIASELGDLLDFLSDINTKTKTELSMNNFEAIKSAIMTRVGA